MFTQTKWDEEGYPVRDPDSTTYVGAIETAEKFRKRLQLDGRFEDSWEAPGGPDFHFYVAHPNSADRYLSRASSQIAWPPPLGADAVNRLSAFASRVYILTLLRPA